MSSYFLGRISGKNLPERYVLIIYYIFKKFMWVFWACPWWFIFWWFQLLYYLNVFFSSLFLPHCSNEDFTKQGQGISVEYRIYLSLLEFHLCMYITNTIYMHPWHLPTVSTLWCANSPFFIKLVRYYCIYYNYIYLHCGLHFFRFLIFREKRRKNEKTYIHVLAYCACAWWDQKKKPQ